MARTLHDVPGPRVELRRAIVDSGLPAWKVSYAAGLTPTVLSHICVGRRDLRDGEVERLATVFERPVEELFPALVAA